MKTQVMTRLRQIERIEQMEHHLECASQAMTRVSAALDELEGAVAVIHELSAYYGSEDWKQDFADDEQGLLPHDLKRGVLSEDGIWNLLEDWRELKVRLAGIASSGQFPNMSVPQHANS